MIRTDWRVPFPVVQDICQCGGVQYMHTFDRKRKTINGRLVQCEKCYVPTQRHDTQHVIYRDVAVRYIERFGGSTFALQTEIDDYTVYLKNDAGVILGIVSALDKYPKPPAAESFSDMPY